MIAYPGLTPRRIDEELTPYEITTLIERCKEQPPSAFQLSKLNTIFESLIGALSGKDPNESKSDSSGKEGPSIQYQFASLGIGVVPLSDGMPK